jgi:surface antigen
MRQLTRFLGITVTVMIMLIVNSNPVQARAWGWAKRLPINQYSPEDIVILRQSMTQALNQAADGEKREWSNPTTGSAGSITPLNTVDENMKMCRQTRFSSFSDEQENHAEFYLCRQADGEWAVEQPVAQ